ncbi:MAG: hypothetical protein Ct9H300mP1_15010 [Planctomycetaceae bacterium]|nr:MAG: hypothetical protein Ct9H300mP1_15010 [Planctomycetaceae bacterium]
MIVSWEWLGQYVALEMPLEDLTTRLTMSGLNLEGTDTVDSDTAIDLEVTSNRPDCLGHLGVAREVSVLYDLPLKSPDPQPPCTTPRVSETASVEITCPELCPRYTARLIRGVTVGPSPDLARSATCHPRHRFDQQHRRHHQLRADGDRPTAACLRF